MFFSKVFHTEYAECDVSKGKFLANPLMCLIQKNNSPTYSELLAQFLCCLYATVLEFRRLSRYLFTKYKTQ